MALQSSDTSLNALQAVRMHTHQQRGNVPVSQPCLGYSAGESAQLESTISLGFVQAPQATISTHGQSTIETISHHTPSAMVGVHQVALQPRKEEQGLPQEQERRIRREIANSNERRRMQSINAGFKSLKSVLPHTDGEKLSKAAILQHTSEYITQLESDKLKLLHQNEKLKKAFALCKCDSTKRRAFADIFEKDEGIGSPAEEDFEDMQKGLVDVRQQLDKERRLRIRYEEQVRNLEDQFHPDRVRSVKLSSSDERRSSSECSPCPVQPAAGLAVTAKPQSCARPLLSPPTPLFAKLDKPDGVLQNWVESKLTSASLSASTQSDAAVVASAQNQLTTVQCKVESSSADVETSYARSENLVTVFSHSTKSNQPLKKRAIEIHHQSLSDSGNDSSTQQPERKIPKIAASHLENTETRPITHFSTEPNNLPMVLTQHSTPIVKSPVVAAGLKIDHFTSPPVSLPQIQNRPVLIPSSTYTQLSQFLPSQYTQIDPVQATGVSMTGPTLIMPPLSNDGGIALTMPQSSSSSHSPPKTESGVYTIVEKASETAGCSSPMYLSIQPQGANIAYLQQDGDRFVQMTPQPHYVVTPMNSPGTVLVPPQNTTKDASGEVTPIQQHITDKLQQTIVACHSTPSLPVTLPAQGMQHPLPSVNPTQVSYAPPQAFLHASTVPRLHAQSQIQSHQTVLCYCQPEITLNQLNAVPNLTLQKSFHQPILVPSLVQPAGGDSPSYVSPTLQEYVLQKQSVLMSSDVLRCRKTSMNSSSTASGTEEEDQAVGQTGQIKSSNTKPADLSPSKQSIQGISVAAYDEVSESFTPKKQKPLDVADATRSNSFPFGSGVSALPEVASSPPVMCHIGAMQTRRNLETIVQAIDHLEQQERRNSQDKSDVPSRVKKSKTR